MGGGLVSVAGTGTGLVSGGAGWATLAAGLEDFAVLLPVVAQAVKSESAPMQAVTIIGRSTRRTFIAAIEEAEIGMREANL